MGADDPTSSSKDLVEETVDPESPIFWKERSDFQPNGCVFCGALSVLFCVLIVSMLMLGGAEYIKNSISGGLIPTATLTKGDNGAVSSGNRVCSQIGVDTLKKGGSAVDATVATALCLCVVHPSELSLMGGGFMVVYEPSDDDINVFGEEVNSFDFREQSGDKEIYLSDLEDAENAMGTFVQGGRATLVPGLVHGLRTAWNMYGRTPWKDLFTPAITLARNGWLIDADMAQTIEWLRNHTSVVRKPDLLARWRNAMTYFQNQTRQGRVVTSPRVADILERLANSPDPIYEFYKGDLAKLIVADIQEAGGTLTVEDFGNYETRISEPHQSWLKGTKLHTSSGSSLGGIIVPFVLNVLEKGDYTSPFAADGVIPSINGETLHALIEAFKWGSNARAVFGDPARVPGMDLAMKTLLSKELASSIRGSIKAQPQNGSYYRRMYDVMMHALKGANLTDEVSFDAMNMKFDERPIDEGTEPVSVVSKRREIVSFIASIGPDFGSGFVGKRTGMFFNSQGQLFNWLKGSPPQNAWEPRKRPASQLTATVMSRGNKPVAALSSNGWMKNDAMHAVIELIMFSTDYGYNRPLGEGLMMPRFTTYLPWNLSIPPVVMYSRELPEVIKVDLRSRGHILEEVDWIGDCNAVFIQPSGQLLAGSEYGHGTPVVY